MSVLYVTIPIALLISVIAVITFVVQVRNGQFDDLETPPRRILFDDADYERIKQPDSSNDKSDSPEEPFGSPKDH